MPINKRNQRDFHRKLYAGQLKSVDLLKRLDDQRQGTVTRYRLHSVRRGQITKTGEQLQGDMSSNHSTVWHIPRQELDRLGIDHLNPLDRIVEYVDDGGKPLQEPRYWQPEATTVILEKLFEQMLNIDCLLTNPPTNVS